MRTPFFLAFVAMTSIASSGCIDVGSLGSSNGREGELDFEFAAPTLLSCLFGCSVDQPILAGGDAIVFVDGGDIDDHFRATTSDKSKATVSYEESYTCTKPTANDEEDRPIKADEDCRDGEEKSVTRVATVTTLRAGTFDLRILDDEGDIVDSVSLTAHDGARVDLFTSAQPSSGRLTLSQGNSIELNAKVYDANDKELLTNGGGFTWTSSSNDVADTTFGFAEALSFVFVRDFTLTSLEARKPGTTEITFATSTTSSVIEVTVPEK